MEAGKYRKEKTVWNFLQKMKDTKPQIQDTMNNKQDMSQHSKTAKSNEKGKDLKQPEKKKFI